MDGPTEPAVNNTDGKNADSSLNPNEEVIEEVNLDSVNTVAIIPASQLTNCYASKSEDLDELASLLNSWNIGEYFANI